MAISGFTKKLMRSMSVEQKTSLAHSTRDVDVLFTMMEDKSSVVSRAAMRNPLRFSLEGVRRELTLRLETSSLLGYVRTHAGEFDREAAREVFAAASDSGLLRELALDLIKQRYSNRGLGLGGRVDGETTLYGLFLAHFLSGHEGKGAEWYVAHPFMASLMGAAAGAGTDEVIRVVYHLSQSRSVSDRAAYLLLSGRDGPLGDAAVLLYALPDLMSEALKKDRTGTLKRLARFPTPYRSDAWGLGPAAAGGGGRDEQEAEAAMVLTAAIRDEIREGGRPELIADYSHVKKLPFTFEEVFQSAERRILALRSKYKGDNFHGWHETGSVARLIEEFGQSHEGAVKELLLGGGIFSHDSESYLAALAEAGRLSLEESAALLRAASERLVPRPEVLAGLYSAGLLAVDKLSPERTRLLALARAAKLSEAHYRVMWDAGERYVKLFLRRGAEEVATENFSPEELWDAMRAERIERTGWTRDLRKRLNRLDELRKRSKSGSGSRGGQGGGGEEASGENLGEASGESLEEGAGETAGESLEEGAGENQGGEAGEDHETKRERGERQKNELVSLFSATPLSALPRLLSDFFSEGVGVGEGDGGSLGGGEKPGAAMVAETAIDFLGELLENSPETFDALAADTGAAEALFLAVLSCYKTGELNRYYRLNGSPLKGRLLRVCGEGFILSFAAGDLDAFLSVVESSGGGRGSSSGSGRGREPWPPMSLSVVAGLLGAPSDLSADRRLVALSSLLGPIGESDLPKVLSLCRSSVEEERLLGFRILPGVMGRISAKDVSRAILRSDEANKKLNKFIYEMSSLGDELGSGVFLLISYVKELYFDHSSVLAADFAETLLTKKSVSSAVLCSPDKLFSFLSLVRRLSADPAYLLGLLSDKSKRGAMFAADIGAAFASVPTEYRAEAVETLRGALRGDRVFRQDYDLRSLAGLHEAISNLGRKYNSADYNFIQEGTPARLRCLYESQIARGGIVVSHGESGAEITVKMVSSNHELIELGDVCSFCIGNGHYSEQARRGDQVHFSLRSEGGDYLGAASFSLPSWELAQMKYRHNRAVPPQVQAAVVRAVTGYVEAHWEDAAGSGSATAAATAAASGDSTAMAG